MPSEGALRVIVADDDPFARRLIKGALEQAGMIVIAEANDGLEAVELGVHHRPDVIVMDAVIPGIDGVHAARRIIKAVPAQLVVMLTVPARTSSRCWPCGRAQSGSSRRTPTARSIRSAGGQRGSCCRELSTGHGGGGSRLGVPPIAPMRWCSSASGSSRVPASGRSRPLCELRVEAPHRAGGV
jgi:CheY-like chemotaxis protein